MEEQSTNMANSSDENSSWPIIRFVNIRRGPSPTTEPPFVPNFASSSEGNENAEELEVVQPEPNPPENPSTTLSEARMMALIFSETDRESPASPESSEPSFEMPNVSPEPQPTTSNIIDVETIEPQSSSPENPPTTSAMPVIRFSEIMREPSPTSESSVPTETVEPLPNTVAIPSMPILRFKNIRRGPSPTPGSSEAPVKMPKYSPSLNRVEQARELERIQPQSGKIFRCPIGAFIYRRRNYELPNSTATQKTLDNSQQYANQTIEGCRTAPLKSDGLVWPFVINGPLGSLYEGARFFGKFTFGSEQPDKVPPHVKFDSMLFHPDCSEFGKLDTRELEREWNETKSIADVIHYVISRMKNPKITDSIDPQECYHPQIAAMSKTDPEKFEKLVREATRQLI